ncbi:hypothetical protein G7Y89_g7328 [Cudoniella acicularis]|uniref:Uncharacterized protein n=1 Tax=Cudoniella acicularis TaxID=354080 RepID=A0A8H4W4N8_9HELO|nr:hypothetical protein G7Y89_g7328 [Cudoniella acicularis]
MDDEAITSCSTIPEAIPTTETRGPGKSKETIAGNTLESPPIYSGNKVRHLKEDDGEPEFDGPRTTNAMVGSVGQIPRFVQPYTRARLAAEPAVAHINTTTTTISQQDHWQPDYPTAAVRALLDNAYMLITLGDFHAGSPCIPFFEDKKEN